VQRLSPPTLLRLMALGGKVTSLLALLPGGPSGRDADTGGNAA
jgi:hypothetical protein